MTHSGLNCFIAPFIVTLAFSAGIIPRGFREAMRHISEKLTENSSIDVAKTKLAPKTAGDAFFGDSKPPSLSFLGLIVNGF